MLTPHVFAIRKTNNPIHKDPNTISLSFNISFNSFHEF
jgi:hypothetical protein